MKNMIPRTTLIGGITRLGDLSLAKDRRPHRQAWRVYMEFLCHKGMRQRDIARHFGLSKKAVGQCLSAARQRLGYENQTELTLAFLLGKLDGETAPDRDPMMAVIVGEMTVADIALASGLTKSAASQRLKRLEEKGLLQAKSISYRGVQTMLMYSKNSLHEGGD